MRRARKRPTGKNWKWNHEQRKVAFSEHRPQFPYHELLAVRFSARLLDFPSPPNLVCAMTDEESTPTPENEAEPEIQAEMQPESEVSESEPDVAEEPQPEALAEMPEEAPSEPEPVEDPQSDEALAEMPEESPSEPEPVADVAAEAPKPKKSKKEQKADEEAEELVAPPANPNFKWYVVKVASNREESIKEAILRRMRIENLEPYVGQIVIPVERVTEVRKTTTTKNGEKKTSEKRVVKEKKKFPGYLMAQVEFNPEVLSLFRDTSGVGDFVGASGVGKPPPPMSDRDVQSMLYGMLPAAQKGEVAKTPVKVKLDFEKGDKVRIRETSFAGMEGEVAMITEPKDTTENLKVQVTVQILGRTVSVDLDYWQVDKL